MTRSSNIVDHLMLVLHFSFLSSKMAYCCRCRRCCVGTFCLVTVGTGVQSVVLDLAWPYSDVMSAVGQPGVLVGFSGRVLVGQAVHLCEVDLVGRASRVGTVKSNRRTSSSNLQWHVHGILHLCTTRQALMAFLKSIFLYMVRVLLSIVGFLYM